MNNLRILIKRGGPKKIFFAVFTSDTVSTAKKNDRARCLFFDPTHEIRDPRQGPYRIPIIPRNRNNLRFVRNNQKKWSIFPSRNLLHWLSRIIAVSGQIITKIWLWGLISDHILSSNKTNCVRDHKKSNYWANFLIIQWLFMILGIIQWLSWLFSDNWWLFMIIQHKSWLFTANQVSPWNAGR